MRQRIVQEFGTDNPWEVKYVRGGLIDVDFIAQFLELSFAHTHPAILHPNSTQVFLNLEEAGLISSDESLRLRQATQFLLDLQASARLLYSEQRISQSFSDPVKKALAKLMHEPSFEDLEEKLLATLADVQGLYTNFLGSIDMLASSSS